MHQQLIPVIIFVAIAIFNMVIRMNSGKNSERGGGTKREPPRDYPPVPDQNRESEEERLRKFMEALGVPNVPEPPRRVVRPRLPATPPLVIQPPLKRTVLVPPPVMQPVPPQPPPIPAPLLEPVISAWEPPAPATPAAALPETAPLDAPDVLVALEPALPVASTTIAAASKTSIPADFQSFLKSPNSLRAAILVKEILGPPRGLQPFAGAGGLL